MVFQTSSSGIRGQLGARRGFRKPGRIMTHLNQISSGDLRARAEADLARSPSVSAPNPATMSQDDLQAAIHEMQVHGIELELQNEELRAAHLEVDALHARYLDLYERAPVGYCCIGADVNGTILEANLTLGFVAGGGTRHAAQSPICQIDSPR